MKWGQNVHSKRILQPFYFPAFEVVECFLLFHVSDLLYQLFINAAGRVEQFMSMDNAAPADL